jgi:hypothetical protein
MTITDNHINHKEAQQPYQHSNEFNLMEDTWGLEWNKKKSKTHNSHVFSCSAGRLVMFLWTYFKLLLLKILIFW